MHFRSLGLSVVTAVLVSSCGGDTGGVTARRDALNVESNGKQEWVLTVEVWPPGVFDFPMDCLGETFEFVGTDQFEDHLIPGPRGLHDNFHLSYDPERFTSLTTGQTWVFAPGFTDTGVYFIGESDFFAANLHETIPLVNSTTGQRVRWEVDFHFARNASGEIKREYFTFGCTLIH